MEKISAQGYTHVKLKVGRQIDAEGEAILKLFDQSPLKLRLDFNVALTPSSFDVFLENIERLKQQIDFIEDPFPLV